MAISSEINATQSQAKRTPVTHGRAFLIEALVVLAFLMTSLAVFAKLFSSAQIEALRANQLSLATQLATNCAEEFSADPLGVPASYEQDGLVVECDVTPTSKDAGTLYEATIVVRSEDGADVYTLSTARYVGEEAGGDA